MVDWRGRKVFLTGHTGFKGGWLALLLEALGAEVVGYSLAPAPRSLYTAAGLAGRWQESIADVRDIDTMRNALLAAKPSVVLHLAAQPLVLASHAAPLETYSTNVMGTANLLESARACQDIEAILIVTTDKVYHPQPHLWNYREGDILGGNDPYSSSKACAEHVTSAYRASFFAHEGAPLIATARAGNVIGGGDWSANRLLPDMVDAFSDDRPVFIRYPKAVRPWQLVIDLLFGYVILVERLLQRQSRFADCWNFAPPVTCFGSVLDVVRLAAAAWGDGTKWEIDERSHLPETGRLALDATKAMTLLNWQPERTLDQAVQETISWYRDVKAGADPLEVTLLQLDKALKYYRGHSML